MSDKQRFQQFVTEAKFVGKDGTHTSYHDSFDGAVQMAMKDWFSGTGNTQYILDLDNPQNNLTTPDAVRVYADSHGITAKQAWIDRKDGLIKDGVVYVEGIPERDPITGDVYNAVADRKARYGHVAKPKPRRY